ncbi:MAG: hypothetical protein O2857_01915 [Planctomycetota bacterium]|nr:hypothetical protein [Planctomycetota bacterium]
MSELVFPSEREGEWVFVIPVQNLVLDNSVQKQFSVERVTFVDIAKFRRQRRRFCVARPVSKLDKYSRGILTSCRTVGVVRQTGKGGEITIPCLRLVQDELSIIACSQLGYSKRKYTGLIGIQGEQGFGEIKFTKFRKGKQDALFSFRLARSNFPLTLSETWLNTHKDHSFFLPLLAILRKETKVTDKTRKDLRKAAILIGKSMNTNDIGLAFLMNMIALEMLVSVDGLKDREAIVRHLEAILGWVGFWDEEGFPERIGELYDRRCNVVHQGDLSGVSKKQLLLSDELLLNLVNNLVRHPELFSSNRKIAEFAHLVEAERLLGQSSKHRREKFIYLRRDYTERDLEEF